MPQGFTTAPHSTVGHITHGPRPFPTDGDGVVLPGTAITGTISNRIPCIPPPLTGSPITSSRPICRPLTAAHEDAGEADGAPPSAGGPPELTPDVKQQIADEVRNQLALENQEAQQNTQQQDVDPASSGIARMVSDGRPHVFVVGSALDVVDNSQTECSLSDGDVLALQTPPPADATVADVVVLSSKGGPECQKQATVSVAFSDLQEMQNHMRETIDQGLQDLQAKQGTGGIPALPPSAQSQPDPAQYAAVAPPPDPNAGDRDSAADSAGRSG